MHDKKHFDRIRGKINEISPSFCAAKWYNATIWLGNGRTASCHHPAAHPVPLRGIEENPSSLHNTAFKKRQRKLMLEGTRPEECGYCWRVEDADASVHSDRTYKSACYSDEEIDYLKTLGWDANVDPKTLEISFDNLCNLSCSYCNAEFSTTWANDVKTNGIYENMKTTGGEAYQNDGSHANPFEIKGESNFYISSFFKWFDSSLKHNLQELRVTGGEPTRSPDFWRLVDKCEGAKFRFAVNTNMMMDEQKLESLVDCSRKFKYFDLYTSCETYGKHAEFVRHGFEYDTWMRNLRHFADNGSYKHIFIMMTISALTLFKMTEFMDEMIDLKREYNSRDLFGMSLNILRFPSFQSVNILPEHIKLKVADQLEAWQATRKGFLRDLENNQLKRLITYLRNVDRSYEDTDSHEDKLNDFVHFFRQYTGRRKLDMATVIPDDDFVQWWNKVNAEIS